MSRFLLVFVCLLVTVNHALGGEAPAAAKKTHPLVWDAMEKTIEAKSGDKFATLEFNVTNRGDHPVSIIEVHPSCGCTTVDLPPLPWTLEPGKGGRLAAKVDIEGKEGELEKSITVETSEGLQALYLTVKLPLLADDVRLRNQQIARANRQEVFRNDCAACHAAPTVGKQGEALFKAACTICHAESGHRASMVPDLGVATVKRDRNYWGKWISEGREGTLMPGFAQVHGGPLSAEQITSLVEFALRRYPTEPAAPAPGR